MIVAFQVTLISLIAVLVLTGGIISGANVTYAFALGCSVEMCQILQEVKGYDLHTIRIGVLMNRAVNSIAQILLFFELAAYVTIFVGLYRNDEKVRLSLSETTVNYRRKRNAISLSGQVICFLTETFVSMLNALILSLGFNLDLSLFPMSITLGSGITALVTMATSPELRRHYCSN